PCPLPRPSHSFPTRRSSDLIAVGDGAADRAHVAHLGIADQMRKLGKAWNFLLNVGAGGDIGVSGARADHHKIAFKPDAHVKKKIDRKSTRLNSSHSQISYAV